MTKKKIKFNECNVFREADGGVTEIRWPSPKLPLLLKSNVEVIIFRKQTWIKSKISVLNIVELENFPEV